MQRLAADAGITASAEAIEGVQKLYDPDSSEPFTLAHVNAVCHLLADSGDFSLANLERIIAGHKETLHEVIKQYDVMGFFEDIPLDEKARALMPRMMKVISPEGRKNLAQCLEAHFGELFPAMNLPGAKAMASDNTPESAAAAGSGARSDADALLEVIRSAPGRIVAVVGARSSGKSKFIREQIMPALQDAGPAILADCASGLTEYAIRELGRPGTVVLDSFDVFSSRLNRGARRVLRPLDPARKASLVLVTDGTCVGDLFELRRWTRPFWTISLS